MRVLGRPFIGSIERVETSEHGAVVDDSRTQMRTPSRIAETLLAALIVARPGRGD